MFAPPLLRLCRSAEVRMAVEPFAFQNASKSLKWRGASPSSHSSFCEEVFSRAHLRTRMSWTGRIFWLLAFGSEKLTFFPPSPPKSFGDWPLGSRIQLQQRNCSRIARDFSRRSTFSSSQRTGSTTTCLRLAAQDLFINRKVAVPSRQIFEVCA